MPVPQFIPSIISMPLHKGEFAYCVGITPYKLKQLIKKHEDKLAKLGYSKYDKVLMPTVVGYLCKVSGLRIEHNRLCECMGRFAGV